MVRIEIPDFEDLEKEEVLEKTQYNIRETEECKQILRDIAELKQKNFRKVSKKDVIQLLERVESLLE